MLPWHVILTRYLDMSKICEWNRWLQRVNFISWGEHVPLTCTEAPQFRLLSVDHTQICQFCCLVRSRWHVVSGELLSSAQALIRTPRSDEVLTFPPGLWGCCDFEVFFDVSGSGFLIKFGDGWRGSDSCNEWPNHRVLLCGWVGWLL